jgi:hypothetical protein
MIRLDFLASGAVAMADLTPAVNAGGLAPGRALRPRA